ncbi:MAG: class I adenylate-forming enzyme family protein [Actinomycetota bacterium]|nr:class I adenylate-forming enzyme family protein [Actinomycetota bacterium]
MSSHLAERRASLERRHGPWRERTLGAMLRAVADEQPDRVFVVDEEVGGASWTYSAIADRATRLARGLVESGVAPGDRVAMVLPNGADFVAVRFAIALAGGVAMPIGHRLKGTELRQVLGVGHPAAVVTMESFRDVDALSNLDQALPGWDDPGGPQHGGGREVRLVVVVPTAGSEPARPGVRALVDLELDDRPELDRELVSRSARVGPADVATIFFTSGTTGRPKGVVSTHDMELRSAYGSAYSRGFEDGRRILFALPSSHVFAYIEGILASMFVAGSVVVQAAFDPEATLEAIERHSVGEVLLVPTMSLAVVSAAARRPRNLSSLHSVMSAAQSAPARLWTDLYETLGVESCITAYGMSETSAATTFTEPGCPIEDLVETVGRPKPGGVAGDPALGGCLAEYRTVDPDTLEELPPGVEGELVVRGPIVTPGYFADPAATAEAMLEGGWLRSGDLGRVRADGALVLTGRSKELYKCGGELVSPVEVESCLCRRPEVDQAYVVGVPDARMGEVGAAWVVPSESARQAIDPVALVEHCRAELARFKVPAYVLVVPAEDLPLTPSGKVQRFVLAERAAKELGLSG